MVEPNYKIPPVSILMLGVKQLAESVPFYRDVLGMTAKQQFEGFAFFEAGPITLVLSESLARASASTAGAMEVVFTVDRVRTHYDTLRARGVEFLAPPFQVNGPMFAANFRDPNGHTLSLFGPE